MVGVLSKLWNSWYGKHLQITATVTFAFGLMFIYSVIHLAFLQDIEGWGDFTAVSIVMVVISGLGLFIVAPEFLHLKGKANLINELMNLTSAAELRRRQAEGDDAARDLGGMFVDKWGNFLQEKGLKMRR